ncbi:MAG: type IV conjugative transfer system coupling protein TraD [Gammaproteobacteria bacterium]
MTNKNAPLRDFTRGGQTLLHFFRMGSQVFKRFFALVVLGWVLSVLGFYYLKTTAYERYAVVKWVVARTAVDWMDPQNTLAFRLSNGREASVSIERLARHPRLLALVRQHQGVLLTACWVGLLLTALLFSGVLWLIIQTGRGLRHEKHLRGGQLTTSQRLTTELRVTGQASDVRIAGVPLLKGAETSHLLITGSPGSGKSLAIRDVLDGIRQRGDRAIIYATTGEFVEHYYRGDCDTILNPLDARCPAWNVWNDCHAPTDYDQVAQSLIPDARSGDPFWTKAAQILFSMTAQRLATQNPSTAALLNYLLTVDLATLQQFLHGTEAAPLVEKDAEKMSLSIRATAAAYARSLKFLRQDDAPPFSIRRWVESDDDDRWLFMTSRADQKAALRPLITSWLDIAAAAILAQAPDPKRRLWVVIDELPSLNRLPSLSALLAMGRKHGACGVLGFQSYAQLCDIYGRHAAEEITGLCSTWVLYRANEPVTAAWCSKALGTVENLEANEGLSYGANEIRDGVNLSMTRQTRPLVMPSEMQALPDRHGYLRLPGDFPIARFEIPYRPRPVIAPGYAPVTTQALTLETPA